MVVISDVAKLGMIEKYICSKIYSEFSKVGESKEWFDTNKIGTEKYGEGNFSVQQVNDKPIELINLMSSGGSPVSLNLKI